MDLHLSGSAIAFDSELLVRVVIDDFLIRRLAYHLTAQNGWCAFGIKRRKLRLVNDCDIFHLKRCCLPVSAKEKPSFRNRDNPEQPRRRNPRMKIVDFVSGDDLPPKQGESKVGKRAGLLGAGSEVLALHHTPIGAGRTECNTVALIVSAHSDEIGAPSDLAFEMVDVRWF